MTPERLQEIRLDRDIASARIDHDMGNGVDHSLVDLLAAYDALSADYAAAILALRSLLPHISVEEEYTNVVTGKARPLRACGVSLSNGLTEGVLASRVVLSTPRAKGVE